MLKELKARHRNIIQMSFNGFSNNEIAEQLGLQHTTISQVLRSPLGQAYMNGLNDKMKNTTLDVRKELISMNKGALTTLKRLLTNTKIPASVQLGTAKDILDRSGFKAPDKLSIDMTLQTKTDEEIDAEIAALKSSLAEIKIEQPKQKEERLGTKEDSQPAENKASLKPPGFIINPPDIHNFRSVRKSAAISPSSANVSSEKSALKPIVGVGTAAPASSLDEDAQVILDDSTFDPFHNIEDA